MLRRKRQISNIPFVEEVTAAQDRENPWWVDRWDDLLSFCSGDGEPTQELITYRAGGKFVARTAPGGIELPTYVYETGPVDGLPWMFGVCDAWANDGIAPPAPLYTGFTTLRVNSNPDIPMWASADQPTGHYRNGLRGVVSDSDGNQFDLSTFVSFPHPRRLAVRLG
ncbi:MAG: hypothetical protein ACI8Y4_004016 [Candidatus Poriferisodalaceae bacterium]